MEAVLLWVTALSCVLNFVLLFFLGLFVVRSHEQTRGMIGGLAELLLGDAPNPVAPTAERQKTWDQKYEDELEAMQRRIREASGLIDLPARPSYDSQFTKEA